ncbi:tripartite tricarboxylate transporter substrate binding protein [Acetobacteraceae bacterium H6797]|nr:tripartite tricarboxylate transporter substrate binding protein [Acetobacteraceae bacterium H6797]
MSLPMSRRLALGVGAAALATPFVSRAQGAWPNRPIRIVVPFGPGGGTDIVMRLMGPKISEILGQPVVIENRAGGGSTVGTDFVAKSAPDGYNFVLATLSSTGVAKGLYKNLPYDPVKDLTAIAPTNFVPICLSVTRVNFEAKDTAEFIAKLKANPGKYTYGSSGVGSTGHLAGANFLMQSGTEAVHVPYRGGGQVFAAMASGEIQFNCDIPSQMLPYVKGGQVRTLFMATDERSPLMPDVPTAAEVGLPNYKAYSWYGIFGPARLPEEITQKMARAVDEALADPLISKRLDEMGTPGMRGYTPAKFADYVKNEIDIWVPIVKASGATAD